MRRRNWWLWGGLALLLIFLVVMAAPGLIAPRSPHERVWPIFDDEGLILRLPLEPGQGGTILGSDMQGRDLFSRCIWAARTSLGLALAITALRILVAVPLGLWAGWSRGWMARWIGALSNTVTALPVLLLLVLLLRPLQGMVTAGGNNRTWIIQFSVLMVLVGIPRLAEAVRRRVEIAAEAPHLEGAVAVGADRWWLLRRHVAPHLLPDVAVTATAELGWVLLLLGQLGVLGIFVGGGEVDNFSGQIYDSIPEWGQMLAVNRGMFVSKPFLVLVPGIALTLASMSFHVLAEGLRRRWQLLS